jgi:hypothetical protein
MFSELTEVQHGIYLRPERFQRRYVVLVQTPSGPFGIIVGNLSDAAAHLALPDHRPMTLAEFDGYRRVQPRNHHASRHPVKRLVGLQTA